MKKLAALVAALLAGIKALVSFDEEDRDILEPPRSSKHYAPHQ